jgi:hypothetical protein
MKSMKLTSIALGLVIALFAVSCSSVIKVTTDFDKSVDFKTYKSFSFINIKISGSVSQMNADRIVNAIKDEMIKKGFIYSESNPDLHVNAITILKDKQTVSASTNYYGYGGMYRPYGYYGGGMASGSTTVSTYDYKDGSISIEMVDVKSSKMVWQGIGNKEIDKPSKDVEAAIKEAVATIMATFPPGATKK